MWLEAQHAYPLLNGDQINTMIKDVVNARSDAEPIYRWQNHQIRRFDQHLYLLKDAANNQANEQSSIHASQHSIQLNSETAFIELLGGGQLSVSKDQPNGLLEGCYQLQCYEGSLIGKTSKACHKILKKNGSKTMASLLGYVKIGLYYCLKDRWYAFLVYLFAKGIPVTRACM